MPAALRGVMRQAHGAVWGSWDPVMEPAAYAPLMLLVYGLAWDVQHAQTAASHAQQAGQGPCTASAQTQQFCTRAAAALPGT